MPPTSESKAALRQAAARLAVTQFLSHRDYLRELYSLAKDAVESYSYLKFAEDLGFSKTNVLRLVITGQRPLTSKAAEKIAKGLDIHGADRRYWTTLIKYANARLPAERDHLFRLLMSYKTKSVPAELNPVQAEYFDEWYHPVIREMTALAGFDGEAEWLKARLSFPLRLEQIKHSLELLEKLGLVAKDSGTGRYKRTEQQVITGAEVDSLAIIRFHQKMIEIGRESITSLPEDVRDIRAVTVTLPKAKIALLKGKIEEWVMEVAAMEDAAEGQKNGEKGGGDEVIQVNVQMFPFTKT